MSIATQISRLTELRNDIRTKLISLTLLSSQTATLSDCKNAIDDIILRTSSDIKTTAGITTVPIGYYNQSTSFEPPSTVQYYYTGSSVPNNSLGSNGDLYFKT